MKLTSRHISNEYDEGHPDHGGDGYWIHLAKGFRNSQDMREPLHVIHEPTKAQAWAVSVEPCDCQDCRR